MANANQPIGLQPINDNGTPWNGQGRMVCFNDPVSAIFKGDPLVYLGSSDAFGVPQVGIGAAGAGNPIAGVLVGRSNGPSGSQVTLTRDNNIYIPSGQVSYGLMVDDPNILFAVQEDSVGGAIAAANSSGQNANLVAGAGSTITGYSGWLLQSSSVGEPDATYQLRILGLLRGPDKAIGTYAEWIVRLNNPQLWSSAGV